MKAKQISLLLLYEYGLHIHNWIKNHTMMSLTKVNCKSESKLVRTVNHILSWQSYINDEMKSSNTKLVITQKKFGVFHSYNQDHKVTFFYILHVSFIAVPSYRIVLWVMILSSLLHFHEE